MQINADIEAISVAKPVPETLGVKERNRCISRREEMCAAARQGNGRHHDFPAAHLFALVRVLAREVRLKIVDQQLVFLVRVARRMQAVARLQQSTA